jgi:hypothetical protein
VTFSYSTDQHGRVRGLGLARSANSYERLLRERTGRRDHAVGEACEIWRVYRPDEARDTIRGIESCETADGIQLWTRAQYSSGFVQLSRMISLRRRPVEPAEVRPAAHLLRWSDWRDLSPPGPAPTRRLTGYEVRLESLQRAGATQTQVMRRRGDWTYLEAIRGDGSRIVALDNRAMFLSYQAGPDGRPTNLSLQLMAPEQLRAIDNVRYEPISPRQSEQVLGETCLYSQQAGPEAVIVTSGTHRECMTGDGLLLRYFSAHRVLQADLTATALSRRAPPLAALMPPREAFDWRAWGIQPVD